MIPELPTYVFDLSWAGVLSFFLAFVLPVLTGLVVKPSWSSTTKGFVLLVLAAVKTVVENAIASQGVSVVPMLYTVALNFFIAVVAYFGLLRGSTLQQSALNSFVK